MNINNQYSIGEGWLDLVNKAQKIIGEFNAHHPELKSPIELSEVKEKWGSLCLELNQYVPELDSKINKLENESLNICENCGIKENVSTTATHGWIMTLCPKCRYEEEEEWDKLMNKVSK